MIELTPQQWQSVASEAEAPPRIVDPATQTRYVLIPEEVYDRVKQLFDSDDDHFVKDMASQVMEVFGRDGWDDPAMDVYNDLDPRVNP